ASYDFIACTVTLMFLDPDTCSGRTRRHAALHPSERLQPDRRRHAYRSLPLPHELFRSRSTKANSALPTTPGNSSNTTKIWTPCTTAPNYSSRHCSLAKAADQPRARDWSSPRLGAHSGTHRTIPHHAGSVF